MAENSKIEWTEATWNPITGCTKISDGCKNCYAFTLAKRLQAMNNPRYINAFDLTLHNDLIELPLKWKKPRCIFVNSMSDLFHEDVPFDFIEKVFYTMNKAHWHIFQVLTKRSERLEELATKLKWTDNIWQGVTVESSKYTYRIDHLRKVPSHIKFISFEPLLSNIENLDLTDIDWAIVGGESGFNARPMEEEWAISLRDQCVEGNVPFFFKQWGGINKKKNGRLLKGRIWDDYPNRSREIDQQVCL